jgi:hypothetical protein
MTASAWHVYNKAKESIGNGTINLKTHAFKVALARSTYTPALTHTALSSVTQAPNGNGYTTGGVSVTQTWTETNGLMTFDSNDPSWTASGGSIIARYAVLYDDTTTSPADQVIAYSLLDTTPADVTTTNGNTLTLQISANGYFTVSGGG